MADRHTTGLIHHPYQPPAGFDAVPPAVHKASTVIFENTQALAQRQWKDKSGYTYGLHGTPTTFMLEERLATMEGGAQCLLVPSGLAAIGLVCQSLLKQGDEILLPDNVYGPAKELANAELAQWGITHRVYDPLDPAQLASLMGPNTRMVWMEAAGSVTLEFPDLLGLMKVIRQHSGVVAVLDNTWGAGLAFNPFAFMDAEGVNVGVKAGVDVSVHALTKYPSGGADVLMGAVITQDEALHLKLKLTHMRLGLGVGANDVEAILRGLPTLALRYAAHDRSTREIAQWLLTQPCISRVLHPALPDSPGHAQWQQLCQGAAGLVTMVFQVPNDQQRVHAFVDALRLFKIGYSWGGPVSLVVPYAIPNMRKYGWASAAQGNMVRLAIGLESTADLIDDLRQAMQVAGLTAA